LVYLDPQRTFNEKQREQLYLETSGFCARCDSPLQLIWNAHHIVHWIAGGKTETNNGMALCQQCHIFLHKERKMITPRGWQKDAVTIFKNVTREKKCFLIDATPGSGKTYLSGFFIQEVRKEYPNIFTIIVVPTTAIKKNFLDAYHDLGIELKSMLNKGRGRPKEFDGAITTYQQLPNLIKTFSTWAKQQQQLLFVFDEIHHTSDDNKWGDAAEVCGNISKKIIAMSGTPFRSDCRKMSFIQYNKEGTAISDVSYNYRKAVSENVCREVIFAWGNGTAEYIINDTNRSVEISEITDEDEQYAAKTIFRPDSDWVEETFGKCDAQLTEYRKTYPNAGGIVVCRPGYGANEEKHIHMIADKIKDILGEKPIVITHEDKDADDAIEKFKKSNDRWIVSVRKIAEGVDIKRLRVMFLCTLTKSELLFRQLVGRIVRVENTEGAPENSQVYIANHPRLTEWADRIMEEAHTGINGEHFSPEEIEIAESMKKEDPSLFNASVTMIAQILRNNSKKTASKNNTTSEPNVKPLHVRKEYKRKKISDLCKRISMKEARVLNRDKVDYSLIRIRIYKYLGVSDINDLIDNYDIAKMDEAITILKEWL